jgi:probable phosphoglycerate mutase
VIDRVVVEADGGARGNPGPAGYGAVVRDATSGEVLAERYGGLGHTTNNVAEYSGLIAGLTAAAELGAREVDVRMDSKLVVEQMSGRWQIKHPGLRPLAAEAAALMRRFATVRFGWIPRERNKLADALANKAMDAAASKPPGVDAASKPPGVDAASKPPRGEAASKPPKAGPPAEAEPARQVAAKDSPARAAARAVAAEAATRTGSTVAATGPRSWEPPTAPPTRLILVRHGETELTASRRYSGRGDVPLSERGQDQARAAASRVAELVGSDPAVVSSPLSRCTGTGAILAEVLGNPPVATDPDLIECDFGDWEGLTFAEVREGWPAEMSAWLASPEVTPPGGESFRAVATRVGRAVSRLRDGYPARSVVVVSHVTPIKLMLRDALAAGDDFLYRLYLDPAGISIVDSWPDGGLAVRTVNDVAHLTPPP